MKLVLVTRDKRVLSAARAALAPADLCVAETWQQGLEKCRDAGLMVVDVLTTIERGCGVGFRRFASAKRAHALAKAIPLMLISPPEGSQPNYLGLEPEFAIATVQRPVSPVLFRRAQTWV